MRIEVMDKVINPKTNAEEWVSKLTFCTINPICFFLTDDSKKRFRTQMKIDSVTSKRIAIMNQREEFLEEMQGNRQFFERYPVLYNAMKVDRLYTLSLVTYCLSFIQNCAIVGYYTIEQKDGVSTKKYENEASKYFVNMLSVLIAVISLLIIIIWWITRHEMKKNLSIITYKKENRISDISTINLLEKIQVYLISPVLEDRGIVNFYFHLVFNVLTVVYKPLFCSFQLLLLINISPVTRYVWDSITEHITQFIVTIFFVIFVVYTFSMLIAQYYYRDFNEDEVSFF